MITQEQKYLNHRAWYWTNGRRRRDVSNPPRYDYFDETGQTLSRGELREIAAREGVTYGLVMQRITRGRPIGARVITRKLISPQEWTRRNLLKAQSAAALRPYESLDAAHATINVGRVVMLQCSSCAYEAQSPDEAKRQCPKCHAYAWETFRKPIEVLAHRCANPNCDRPAFGPFCCRNCKIAHERGTAPTHSYRCDLELDRETESEDVSEEVNDDALEEMDEE